MPYLVWLIAAVMVQLTPADASSDAMAVQRCVWACLSNSKGANDPAYHACVSQRCSGQETPRSTEEMDQNKVADVQRRLNALGFNAGTVDGVYGRKTAQAINAFRTSHGLPQSTEISDELMKAISKAEN